MVSVVQYGTTQIHIGIGALEKAKDILLYEKNSPNIFLLLGRNSFQNNSGIESLFNQFSSIGKVGEIVNVAPFPSFEECNKISDKLRQSYASHIVAIGGGSVLDTAKITNIAAGIQSVTSELFQTPSKQLKKFCKQLILIPTTTGSGAEITPFATLWDFKNSIKLSLDTPAAAPTHTIIDASLMKSLPLQLTQSTITDCLSHALESMWTKKNNPYVNLLAMQAINIIWDNFPKYIRESRNLDLIHQLNWASLLAGMAISETRTAAAHAISYPLTIKFGIPHGQAVGSLLSNVFKKNLKSLASENIKSLKICFKTEQASELPKKLDSFLRTYLQVPFLSSFGVNETDIPDIINQSLASGRMNNNICQLSSKDIDDVIRGSM